MKRWLPFTMLALAILLPTGVARADPYVGIGIGPTVQVDDWPTQVRVEQEIGYSFDGNHGFFLSFAPSQTWSNNYWMLAFPLGIGGLFEVYRNSNIELQLGPMGTVGVAIANDFDRSDRDTDVWFHFSGAFMLRIMLMRGRFGIYVKPVGFEFGAGARSVRGYGNFDARYFATGGISTTSDAFAGRVVVSGVTGLAGGRLAPALTADGADVIGLSRSAARARGVVPALAGAVRWSGADAPLPDGALDGADAVVHLAGEPVSGRWSAAKKGRIERSRVEGTRRIVDAIERASPPPRVLVSASAMGYYGERGEDVVTEDDPPADDFLARVCVGWEREARRAEELGVRVVRLRIGLLLDPAGGALGQMLPLFKAGLGGPIRERAAVVGLAPPGRPGRGDPRSAARRLDGGRLQRGRAGARAPAGLREDARGDPRPADVRPSPRLRAPGRARRLRGGGARQPPPRAGAPHGARLRLSLPGAARRARGAPRGPSVVAESPMGSEWGAAGCCTCRVLPLLLRAPRHGSARGPRLAVRRAPMSFEPATTVIARTPPRSRPTVPGITARRPSEPALADAPARDRGTLLVLNGARAGAVLCVPPAGALVLAAGTRPTSASTMNRCRASHARIEDRDGAFRIRDFSSANGTSAARSASTRASTSWRPATGSGLGRSSCCASTSTPADEQRVLRELYDSAIRDPRPTRSTAATSRTSSSARSRTRAGTGARSPR